MIGSNFEQRVQNVKDFIQVRDTIARTEGNFCRVTFQLTFTETGAEEIPEVVKLAASLGVNRVKGHHLWVFTKEMENESMRRDPQAIQKWNGIARLAQEAAEKYRLPDGEKVFLENIYELDGCAIEELLSEGVCPFLGQEAWVSAEGRFNPCCAPDKDRRKLGDFGTLENQSIEDVWTNRSYNNLQKNYLQNEVCKRCNMRKKINNLGTPRNEAELAKI